MSTALVHSYIGKFSTELFSSQGLNKAYCSEFLFYFLLPTASDESDENTLPAKNNQLYSNNK